MKRNIIAISVVIIAIATSYTLLNKKKSNEQALTLYGNVDIRQVSLAFEQSGRIISLNVQEGDRVQKDDIVAQLNTESLQIQARQAQATLNSQKQAVLKQATGNRPEEIAQAEALLLSAKAQLKKANKDLQRLQMLNGKLNGQAISEQEFDLAKSNQEIAVATIKEREAYLELLQNGARIEDRAITKALYDVSQANLDLILYQISQSELRSPVNAIVRARLQEVGDMTTPQKAVYTLALIDPKWVRVYVNEKDLGRINMGNLAEIRQDSTPNQPIIGRIGYISSVAEFTPKSVQTEDIRTTLVYEVRIYVEDPKDQLKMGQPVTAKVSLTNINQE